MVQRLDTEGRSRTLGADRAIRTTDLRATADPCDRLRSYDEPGGMRVHARRGFGPAYRVSW
jgi:hypothetical protein